MTGLVHSIVAGVAPTFYRNGYPVARQTRAVAVLHSAQAARSTDFSAVCSLVTWRLEYERPTSGWTYGSCVGVWSGIPTAGRSALTEPGVVGGKLPQVPESEGSGAMVARVHSTFPMCCCPASVLHSSRCHVRHSTLEWAASVRR